MKRAIALLLLAAGCTQETPQPAADVPLPVDAAPFIARAATHADAEMMALVRGQLTITEGCVRFAGPVGNPGRLVVWPRETIVDASTGAVRITNTTNGSVVSVGDTVEMNGGEADALEPSALLEPPPTSCPGPYWIAGSHWTAPAAN